MVPNPPAKELLPWVHQKNQGYRLIVSKQCEDEFYKDQGVSCVHSWVAGWFGQSSVFNLTPRCMGHAAGSGWAFAGAPLVGAALHGTF